MKKLFSFLSNQTEEDATDDLDVIEEIRNREEEPVYRKGPDLGPIDDFGIEPVQKAYGCDYGGCDSSLQALVIDLGSSMMKCGFSGDDAPRAVFPTITGRPKNPGIMVGIEKDHFVGDEAQAKRGILILNNPIEQGLVTNWDDFQKVLNHTFYNELRVTPEEHPVFMSETTLTPRENRERLTKLIFENFNCPAFYLASRSVSSLYASGRTTGLTAGIGDSQYTCVSVYEGQEIPSTAIKVPIGGRAVTNHMIKLLEERGYEMTTSAEREIVRDVKEKLGYIALFYDEELNKAETSAHCEHEYELPDGSKMTIGSERFRSTEILFKPSFIGSEEYGFHESIYSCIQKSDIDIRKDLYQNIVLWGGGTMFEGIVERVSLEIQKVGPKHARCKVNAPAERKFSSWIGGSIFSSLSTFQEKWIAKDEYDDLGPSIVQRKCL